MIYTSHFFFFFSYVFFNFSTALRHAIKLKKRTQDGGGGIGGRDLKPTQPLQNIF